MEESRFHIRDYPNDVYKAVGQIIQAAQEWEQEYKKLANMLNVPIRKIGKASLHRLNNELKKHSLISDKDYNNLKKVIEIRNYINHKFYLTDFQKQYENYEKKIQKLEEILNQAEFLIFEATDIVDNQIDKLRGHKSMRPTIFDKI